MGMQNKILYNSLLTTSKNSTPFNRKLIILTDLNALNNLNTFYILANLNILLAFIDCTIFPLTTLNKT